MSSIRETILAESFARLTATPLTGVDASDVRRLHRTPVNRDNSSAVHQVDGDDDRRSGVAGSKNVCAQPREVAWKVSIYARSDVAGHLTVDALMLEVLHRMNPATAAWPRGVIVQYGTISYDNEVADEDVSKLDIAFTAGYQTPEWQLDASG